MQKVQILLLLALRLGAAVVFSAEGEAEKPQKAGWSEDGGLVRTDRRKNIFVCITI